jgi:hypothetical protein
MYKIRTPGYSKRDLIKRWALPDRVFFACGACHILAYAFLEKHSALDMKALWIKPGEGYKSGHIVAAWGEWVFDYHGYSKWELYRTHTWKRARQWWPGWNASVCELAREVLLSEARSREIEGLWLREPGQFLHDAMPRARAFLERFPSPPAGANTNQVGNLVC